MKKLSKTEKLRQQALNMDTATLLSELPKLAKRANSRLSYIEQRSVDGESAINLSTAYSDFFKSATTAKEGSAIYRKAKETELPRFRQGGFKKLTSNQQASVYVALQEFLQAETSTLKGVKKAYNKELQSYQDTMDIYTKNLKSDIKDWEDRLKSHPTASQAEKDYTAGEIAKIQAKINNATRLTPKQLRELYQSEFWEVMRRQYGSDDAFDLIDDLLDNGITLEQLYEGLDRKQAKNMRLGGDDIKSRHNIAKEMKEKHDILNPDDFREWLEE